MQKYVILKFVTQGGENEWIIKYGIRGGGSQKLVLSRLFDKKNIKYNASITTYTCKKLGFTLAEVLITLAIIGVVAVLTIPTLIQSYKVKQASAQLKKFNSVMRQAVMLSEIENGSIFTWKRHGNIEDENNEADYSANALEATEYFNTYLANYIKYASLETPGQSGNEVYLKFLDGSGVKIHNGGCLDLYYDLNAENPPNTYGKDIFIFLLCNDKIEAKNYLGSENNYFGAYNGIKYDNNINSREDLLDACKEAPSYCSLLLQYDNWEFKEDYPFKL